MMPTPFEPALSAGRRNAGTAPARVAALTSAPCVEQQAHDIGVAFARRDHERRLVIVGLARIDRRAGGQQARGDRGVAGARGEHQRRLTGLIDERRVCAGFEQQLDRREIAVRDREMQRRHALSVRGGSDRRPRRAAGSAVARSSTRTTQCSAGVP